MSLSGEYMNNALNSQRNTLIDIACILMIGIGFGGLLMYWYAINHPQDLYQAQSHTIIVPQDNTAGKGNKPDTHNGYIEI